MNGLALRNGPRLSCLKFFTPESIAAKETILSYQPAAADTPAKLLFGSMEIRMFTRLTEIVRRALGIAKLTESELGQVPRIAILGAVVGPLPPPEFLA